MKKAFYKMCVTICERFYPDEGAVAALRQPNSGEIYRKWGVQIAGMIFQTGSKLNKEETWKKNN